MAPSVLTNNEAIEDGTNLTVGHPTAFAAPVVPSGRCGRFPTGNGAAVQPGTLGLLAAMGTVAVLAARRRMTRRARR